MSAHSAKPHRAIDHVVCFMTCGFLAPPFIAWLVSSGPNGEESAFTIFAPFASTVVLVVLLLVAELIERAVADSRAGWPPALLGVPVACIAAGLAFAGLAWGTAVAAIGWRRWRARLGALTPETAPS